MDNLTESYYWIIKRRRSHLPFWIAARMPRWLVYHCAIRLGVHATTGEYSSQVVPELTFMDALQRWEK